MRLLLISLLLATPALALEPYLVKDINPYPEPGHSSPGAFVTLGGAALFAADDASGRELWRSDGTAGGTWQVADLCAGEGCSGNPGRFAVTDRLYFFTANEDAAGRRRLWATDGTPAGTVSLGVAAEGQPLWLPAQGVLYFSGSDGEHGFELWRTDGTLGGTYMVSDLLPGALGSGPRGLTLYKGRIWFGAVGPKGGALFSSDGTAKGTGLIKELGKTSLSFDPRNLRPFYLHVLGKRLVFAADAGLGRQDLWASDGTAKGTARLTQWTRGTKLSLVYHFVVQGSRSYVVADDGRNGQELWVTDGTAKGTRAVTRFARPAPFYVDSYVDPTMLLVPNLTGGRFLFGAHDGSHGLELWSTDGTVKGTGLVKDVCPGECLGLGSVWLAHGGSLYFSGNDGVHGWELWATNGTAAGTGLVRDLCPGSCDGSPSDPLVLGNRLVFRADDPTGGQVWSTDGTEAGTVRVSGFSPGLDWGFFQGTILQGRILFGAPDEAHGYELWSTDGTAAGTALVEDIHGVDLGGSDPVSLRALGDLALFIADDGVHGFEIWKSDGTEAGTALVAEQIPGEAPNQQRGMVASEVAGGKLFFVLNQQVWRTDGTEAGTLVLTGPRVSICCSGRIRAVGDRVFFPAYDGEYRVWVSDGTVEGTHPAGDTGGGQIHELADFQGKLYFTVRGEDSWELWRSDGTGAGTVLVEDLGILPETPHLTVHAGSLWYFANDGETGAELRRGNGTGIGTVLVVDLAAGPSSFEPGFVASLGSRLIVSGDEGLWSTDGTAEGTQLLGPAQTEFHQISTVFQGRLYYHAYEGAVTLWVTDGTPGGTRRLKDSEAYDFAPLGDRLLFTADDGWIWQTDGASAARLLEQGRGASWELVRAGSKVFFPAFDRATGVELWAVE